MLIRPLIQRELLRECRRRSHFVLRTIFVAALGLVVGYIGLRLIRITEYSASSAQIVAARYGTTLFLTWAIALLIGLCVLSTVRAASLADERRVGSLPLIRTTAISDSGIVIAWFFSVMGRALFTMVLTAPVLVICSSFGGFVAIQVIGVCWLALAAAATSTALTLVLASLSRNTSTAIAVSIALQVLGILLANWYVGIQFQEEEACWIGASTMFPYITFEGFGSQMFGSSVNPTNFLIEKLAWLSISRLIALPFFLLFAIWRLRRSAPNMGRTLKGWLIRMDHVFLRMSSKRQILWRSGLGPCRGNPVLWRERAVSLIGQRDHLIRIGYISMLLVVGLALAPALFLVLVLVIAPAMTFPKERQKKALDLLAVTPLPARQIVMGKYLFAVRGLTIPLALVVVFLVIAGATIGIEIETVCLLLMPFMLGMVVIAATLYVGAASRTPLPAIAGGLAILATVIFAMIPGVSDEFFDHSFFELVMFGLSLGGPVLFLVWMIRHIVLAVSGRPHPHRPGAFGRTVTALLLISLAGFFLRQFAFSDHFYPYYDRGPGVTVSSFLVLICVSALGITFFLSAAWTSLDRLIGRNG